MPVLKPLGLDRVTSDVIVKADLGLPMCLSSFEAFRRGWRLAESPGSGVSGPNRNSELYHHRLEDQSTQAPDSSGNMMSAESSTTASVTFAARQLPHLVITNYASLQDWKRCCVCGDRQAQCCGEPPTTTTTTTTTTTPPSLTCPNVIIYTCNESGNNSAAVAAARMNEDQDLDSLDTTWWWNTTTTSPPTTTPPTTTPPTNTSANTPGGPPPPPFFVCTTYATLNARADKFKRRGWGAVIMEFSRMIPFPHSHMIENLLSLKCVQWYTVNKPLKVFQKFDTHWQDIYWEARSFNRVVLSSSLAKHNSERRRRPKSRGSLKNCGSLAVLLADETDSAAAAAAAAESPCGGGSRSSGGEALRLIGGGCQRSSSSKTTASSPAPSVSPVLGGTFWSYMEPGIGSDAANEPLPGCHSVLAFLANWRPSSLNAEVRLSCPVLAGGIWFVRAEPCSMDKQMLEVAMAHCRPERWEELYNEYFSTTHCPLDFAQLRCLVCGSTCADVLMRCCKSVFHRDCLLTELLSEIKCPHCGAEPAFQEEGWSTTLADLEARLLIPGSYCIVDLRSREYRCHDWSCQLTRQVITSAIQNHLTTTTTLHADLGSAPETDEWGKVLAAPSGSFRCFTARTHNAEALTAKIFHETRELITKQLFPKKSNRHDWLADQEEEVLYIFFTTKTTECQIKPRSDRERFIVVTLVAGILDQVSPLITDHHLANFKFRLRV